MLVLGLLGLITSLPRPHSLIVDSRRLSLRLHGPEDEKYSLKGALTRVEAGEAASLSFQSLRCRMPSSSWASSSQLAVWSEWVF